MKVNTKNNLIMWKNDPPGVPPDSITMHTIGSLKYAAAKAASLGPAAANSPKPVPLSAREQRSLCEFDEIVRKSRESQEHAVNEHLEKGGIL